MRTLLDLQLPRVQDRLRLPVVTTARKLQAEENNRTSLEQFIAECCIEQMGEEMPYKDFFDRFEAWLDPSERGRWSRKATIKELPMRFLPFNGHANKKYIRNLVLRPEEKESC
jgi:phage/plasmid-associated DNA primase